MKDDHHPGTDEPFPFYPYPVAPHGMARTVPLVQGLCLLLWCVVHVTTTCSGPALADAAVAAGFCAQVFQAGLQAPRGLVVTPLGDVLVVERGAGRIVALHDDDGDGVAEGLSVIVTQAGLNHGLAHHGAYLYASTPTTVYRWPYVEGQRSGAGAGTAVVTNMNADGNGGAPFGHTTRSLAFDAQGRLYVPVGSAENVDQDSHRARIRRFDLNAGTLPIDFGAGEVFADGLRNEVGLAFDRHGVLWGVENSADNLYRSDLGGDIHNDNPAEELNRFPEALAGQHWGYPYCWTQYSESSSANWQGQPRGTAWAWPSFMSDGTHTDAWCRAQTQPAALAMQAHSAPLGIAFYGYNCTPTALPQWMDGYALIGFHGSWNRDTPSGYKVVYVPMAANGTAAAAPVDLLWHAGSGAKWPSQNRPVVVAVDRQGRLLVTDDGAGLVILVQSTGASDCTQGAASSPSSRAVRAVDWARWVPLGPRLLLLTAWLWLVAAP